jgi:periplasmic protein TonB
MLAGAAALVLFTVAIVWLIRGFMEGATPPPPVKEIKITLVKPPDPPKPPEKPPEPEKIEEKLEEKVKLDEPPPEPAPAEAPPPGAGIPDGPPGGMATDLARGSGNFIGGSGGGDRQAWYARMIGRHLEESLRRSKRLQGSSYQVVAQVWFDPQGGIQRVQLARGSGNPQTDTAIREELLALPPLREALPGDLPQPVNVRVASRA